MIAFGVDPGCSQPHLPEIPAIAFEDTTEATLLRFVALVCVRKAIRARKKKLSLKKDDKEKPDLLSVFMRFKDENGNSCSDFLKDKCLNFILAGKYTSPFALSWVFWLLD
ncbi:cytochrome p450 86b1-like protein [Trifolium pratense]|uniref:Cytochrome p450 86b1-like protein n=1 Tax=Trifolium pratense TaxID=57577 RepID=A0A2K3NDG2_TRIPR|nr:cytochrome p450 86b1-like protein [Trifolium pratense]